MLQTKVQKTKKEITAFFTEAVPFAQYSNVQFHNGMNPWLSKEPNNGNGNEDCVVMDVHDGKWNDVPCDKKTFSICEWT